MIKRGTIVLTKFPFTDLQSYKRRPAVVVSKENKTRDDYILAFITSVIPDPISKTDFLLTTAIRIIKTHDSKNRL